ncbi:MAG: methyltransferase domain-containing protein [Oscillatoria sp. PMC 1051.18]|nr:class I SAM-dependent methyltransferase [Oscillatoria salina IIICB1]MEC5031087.1 methyltransferase domain-containing protein [Oscillatoria sp. PMC 1051.18]NET89067.1 class I SAM-dependent methyltransferase [Kamptonema sp. SIO1D9]
MAEEYLTRERLSSYYNQVRIIKSLGKQVENILEIGIYNSLFTEMLKINNYKITTADVNPELKPDLIVDLETDFSLPQDKFEVIVLFQVLEHIPYQKFESTLKKLAEATKKYLVISLPYQTTFLSMRFKFNTPGRARYLLLQVPNFWSSTPLCEQHYWEIGIKEYPLKRIVKSIKNVGLIIKREYQDPNNPYHYFFVLEKET